MAPCYSGPIPVTDQERATIWRWAKANGIDHGLPFDKVGDAINTHFFAGQAKPGWITDILSGRKTPYRELANDAWKKQYNRRVIVQQAQAQSKAAAYGPIAKAAGAILGAPRALTVFAHGWVFPVTHGGDLVLRPQSWGVFFKGLLNTYSKMGSKAGTERLLDSMRRDPLYDVALRSGLDVGARSHAGNLVNRPAKGSMSTRAWDVLTTMRFDLWNHEMQKHVEPKMSQAEVLDIGKNLAEWANHATGSAKGPISSLGGNILFGPKLTQSKWNRLVSDPIKTLRTFGNWKNATAGEKAAAWTRSSGLSQYVLTGLGFLAANQGLLWALGQKQQINFSDPHKSDWLAFKMGGLEWSLPGMHSEFKFLGQILAASYMSQKELHAKSKGDYLAAKLGNYALSKVNPAIGLAKEILTQRTFPNRPVPWSPEQGTLKYPHMGWLEYGLTHGPILLGGPVRYFYEQTRYKGASALDATKVTKALIIAGVGATGIHIGAPEERPKPPPEMVKAEKQRIAQKSAATRKAHAIEKRRAAVAAQLLRKP